MEALNNDRFLKDILQNSRKEITSPHFEDMMLQKILASDKKRRRVKNLMLYALIFLSADAIMFTLYKLFNLGLGANALPSAPKASLLIRSAENFLNHHNNWIIPLLGVIFLFSIASWVSSGLGSARVRNS
jgi:hypothetical protein